MMFYSTSCNYYKVKKVTGNDNLKIHNIGNLHKKMIVHVGEETFVLEDTKVDSLLLSGKLSYADSTTFYYNEGNKNKQYKLKEKNILQEVHFYLTDIEIKPPFAQIPLQNIKEIRIIEPDSGRTNASYAFTFIGALMGVFVIVMIIVLLTKSSCPYVYVYDGETYIFEGETFGGAIAQNLERDDYMPLPDIRGNHGHYKIRISNELKEIQYTDLAELIVVDHPENSEVLLDKKGNPHVLFNKISASQAKSENGDNLLSVLDKKDNDVFLFNEHNATSNTVFLTFDKPSDAAKGQLVLHAKNTLWFDYIFGEFLSKFGSAYPGWMQKQSAMSGEERLKKISENKFPLSVYVKKNKKWQLVDEIMTVGPLAYRNFVIPIDVLDIPEKEVEIKLETGFMFWEIDAAAIDYSSGGVVNVEVVKPYFANGSGAKDWTQSLMYVDQDYMIQPEPGNITEITYKTKPATRELTQSVFLHSRGYYTLVRDFNGLPDLTALNKFKTPGYFSFYSRSNYQKILENEHNMICFKYQN